MATGISNLQGFDIHTKICVGEANYNLQHPDFGVCECSHDMAI